MIRRRILSRARSGSLHQVVWPCSSQSHSPKPPNMMKLLSPTSCLVNRTNADDDGVLLGRTSEVDECLGEQSRIAPVATATIVKPRPAKEEEA
jgi:hypothetical protein